jgi:cephalosporin hydroxylase
MTEFKQEIAGRISDMMDNKPLNDMAMAFLQATTGPKYSYNYHWQDRPIIQYPQDIVAMQELIWSVKPDLIIETGIAHGGSLIFSASMLALLDMCDAIEAGTIMDPSKSSRKVLGIDIDIREHNRTAIQNFAQVQKAAEGYERVLVCLDSNHTHDHVRSELELYAPLTSVGSYCVVFDTLIEDMPADEYPDRSWGPGNNPKTAVWNYLETHPEFEIDKSIPAKLLITVAHDGFLKRLR